MKSTAARRGPLTALAALLALVLLASPAAADIVRQSGDDGYVPTLRFAGDSRVDTAALVAEETAPEADTVVLADAGDFPDALAGSALGAPILLTGGDALDPVTAAALEDRGASTVLVLGGESALGTGVVDDLEDAGYTTDRLAGDDRFATAAAVARFATGAGGAPSTTAILSNGRQFPDALAAAPLAAAENLPLLLTEVDALPPATAEALDDLGIERVVVPGGTAVVSDGVVDEVGDLGIEVERVAGSDRTTTAIALSDFAAAEYGWERDVLTLARGDAFPDALAIGARAGSLESPLLLTGTDELPPATTEHLVGLGDETVERLEIAGGAVSVSAETQQAAREALAGEVTDEGTEEGPRIGGIDLERPPTAQPGDTVNVLVTVTGADGEPLPGQVVTLEAYRTVTTQDATASFPEVFSETRGVDGNGQTSYGVTLGVDEVTWYIVCGPLPSGEAAPSCLQDDADVLEVVDGTATNVRTDLATNGIKLFFRRSTAGVQAVAADQLGLAPVGAR